MTTSLAGSQSFSFFYPSLLSGQSGNTDGHPSPQDLRDIHLSVTPSIFLRLIRPMFLQIGEDNMVRHPILDSGKNSTTFLNLAGDVLHLSTPGRSIIVLNSTKAAVDLLDKRGTNYSDRPRFPLGEQYVLTQTSHSCHLTWRSIGLDSFALLPYGKRWKKLTNMLQHHINANNLTEFRPIQLREARILLQRLLCVNENNSNQLHHFVRR